MISYSQPGHDKRITYTDRRVLALILAPLAGGRRSPSFTGSCMTKAVGIVTGSMLVVQWQPDPKLSRISRHSALLLDAILPSA